MSNQNRQVGGNTQSPTQSRVQSHVQPRVETTPVGNQTANGSGVVSQSGAKRVSYSLRGKRRDLYRRYTVRVPLVDSSVTDWWDVQADPSESVRKLIRDEIVKHGFTDTPNRPVAPAVVGGVEDVQVSGQGSDLDEESLAIITEHVRLMLSGEADVLEQLGDTPEKDFPIVDMDTVDIPREDQPGGVNVAVDVVQYDMDDIFGHEVVNSKTSAHVSSSGGE